MIEHLSAFQTNYGRQILPVKRIMLFSPAEWEEFIEEWLEVKKDEYVSIDHLGGSGDQGRDVVAYVTDKKDPEYIWDCYQCKHYESVLAPTDVYKEIGKILYYTYIGEYPIPRAYYFVAPRACGTLLSKYLQNEEELKKATIRNWKRYCEGEITKKKKIELEGNFLEYVENFDYSIFDKKLPKNIVDEHRKHHNHIAIFGGGLPPRPVLNEIDIPVDIQSAESVYVSQLLLAYGSDKSSIFCNFDSLPEDSDYRKHFISTRINFHYAEQLRNFSRDNLPRGVFENFQDQVFDGIENLLYENHDSGFTKINSVENHVSTISISGNPLWDSSQIKDRKGICHQLTNDGKIIWTQP